MPASARAAAEALAAADAASRTWERVASMKAAVARARKKTTQITGKMMKPELLALPLRVDAARRASSALKAVDLLAACWQSMALWPGVEVELAAILVDDGPHMVVVVDYTRCDRDQQLRPSNRVGLVLE